MISDSAEAEPLWNCKGSIMTIKGTTAANFHEGSRSEPLAEYIFRAFGTSYSVPRQEDTGLDLHCTLCDKIGHRLHVRNYYNIQIKSQKEKWSFCEPSEIEWLVSHHYPLFYCYIDKKSSTLELFQTLLLSQCYMKPSIRSLTLISDDIDNPFQLREKENNYLIYMGKPILKFRSTEIENKDNLDNYKKVLESWIRLDQSNINYKLIGFRLFNVPISYKTNQPLAPATRWIANLSEIEFQDKIKSTSDDAFLKLLSQMIHRSVIERNIEKFKLLKYFSGKLLHKAYMQDCWGIRLLAMAVNLASDFLGFKGRRISIRNSSGEVIETKTIESPEEIYK